MAAATTRCGNHECLRRLSRDLREVQANPLSTIAAAPHEDNLQTWRVTFTAPDGVYEGVPFHMSINFPGSYPRDPPRVRLCTLIPHPNVFEGYDYNADCSEDGVWLCLNMLRSASHGSYSGWSGAYSMHSILVQLQSFLFAENIDQDYGYATAAETDGCDYAIDAAIEFHKKHGHEFPPLVTDLTLRPPGWLSGFLSSRRRVFWFNPDNPRDVRLAPSARCPAQSMDHRRKRGTSVNDYAAALLAAALLAEEEAAMQQEGIHRGSTEPELGRPSASTATDFAARDATDSLVTLLPEEILVKIADNLPPEAVSALFRTCKAAAGALSRAQLAARRELLCFYSKVRFTETVLGFGLRVDHGRPNPHGAGRHIKTISTELELLSRESFEQGVRTSVWQRPFNLWLPVLLDQGHSKRSLPLAQQRLMAIAGYPQNARFDPMVVLTVLPRLLNQMTVSLMKVNDNTSLHASEKALLGFTSFHHLLLRLAAEYPAIQERAQFWVQEFMRSPGRRSKLVIHDLGEFLVLLYLCPPGTWDRLASMFLAESFVRNVRWLLDPRHGDSGVLAVLEGDGCVSDYRMQQTLRVSGTSKRLLMFQVFFLRSVACPAGATPRQLLEDYERRLGRPPPGTAMKLQTACKKILNELSWTSFLEQMGVCLTDSELCDALREGFRTSEERGYHNTKHIDWRRLRHERARVDDAYTLDDGSETSGSDAVSSVSEGQTWTGGAAQRTQRTQRVKLFIAGLQPTQTEEQLRQLCCSFGRPAAVQKLLGSRTAFVWFDAVDEADAALVYLREVTVFGHALRVERARHGHYVHSSEHTSGRASGHGSKRQSRNHKLEKCPHPPQSLAAKQWYKEHGRY